MLEKLIKDIARMSAKIFLNKEEENEIVDLGQINSNNILPVLLKRLIYAGEYNKAENIIFDELSKDNSEDIYDIAVDFYNYLLTKTDDELEKCNFSRDEIYQGLEDIKKYGIKSI